MEKEPTPEQQAFLREADRLAHQSKKTQARWLQELETRLSQQLNRKAILKAVKKYLLAKKQKADAAARLSHAEGQLAAKIIEEFKGLIQSKFSLPRDERARLKYLAKLTTLGQLIPDVKERLARPAAQEYLE